MSPAICQWTDLGQTSQSQDPNICVVKPGVQTSAHDEHALGLMDLLQSVMWCLTSCTTVRRRRLVTVMYALVNTSNEGCMVLSMVKARLGRAE